MQRFLEAVIACLALWSVVGFYFLHQLRVMGGLFSQLQRMIRGEESLAVMLAGGPLHPEQVFVLMESHRVTLTSWIAVADDPSNLIPASVPAACRRIHSVRDAWTL